jgi:lysophospholipase L1-like esterase
MDRFGHGANGRRFHRIVAAVGGICLLGVLLSGCGSAGASAFLRFPSPPRTGAAAVQTPAGRPAPTPVKTPVKTPKPTPTPVPTPVPSIPLADSACVVPKTKRASDHYFDDAVFIGDSITEGLQLYATRMRASHPGYLGRAQFVVARSLGSGNALKTPGPRTVHPFYHGKKMSVEDCVAKTGAKKAYIMLGLNDLDAYGVKRSVSNLSQLIDRIRAKCKGIEIFIQSATPMTRAGEKKHLNNGSLLEYNSRLSALCRDKGYHFIDVASALRDKKGFLPPDWSSDNYVHFKNHAYQLWVDYLYTHAL